MSIFPANPARSTRLANLALVFLLTAPFSARRAFSFASETGSSQPQTQGSAKVAVKAAYEAYLQAWKDKDYDALEELLSDDYEAVNFQGVISTKTNEIATAKNDRTIMSGHVMSAAVFGESAVVSGLIEASWKDESGTIQKSTFRFLAMLQNQKGVWRLVATQSTKFNKPAEPLKK